MADLCHREPEFFGMMRACRDRLVRLAGCAERFAAVLSRVGDGRRGGRRLFGVPRDRAVLIVNNGVYGDRMARIARVHGIPAEVLTYES